MNSETLLLFDSLYEEYEKECEIVSSFKRKRNEKVFGEFFGFACHGCGHKRIRFTYTSQMRSADEPAYQYFECEACGKKDNHVSEA